MTNADVTPDEACMLVAEGTARIHGRDMMGVAWLHAHDVLTDRAEPESGVRRSRVAKMVHAMVPQEIVPERPVPTDHDMMPSYAVDTPFASANRKDVVRGVHEALGMITERERLVVCLRHEILVHEDHPATPENHRETDGLSYEQIGRIIGVSRSRTMQIHNRAMRRLASKTISRRLKRLSGDDGDTYRNMPWDAGSGRMVSIAPSRVAAEAHSKRRRAEETFGADDMLHRMRSMVPLMDAGIQLDSIRNGIARYAALLKEQDRALSAKRDLEWDERDEARFRRRNGIDRRAQARMQAETIEAELLRIAIAPVCARFPKVQVRLAAMPSHHGEGPSFFIFARSQGRQSTVHGPEILGRRPMTAGDVDQDVIDGLGRDLLAFEIAALPTMPEIDEDAFE